ncbi:MAG: MATE family efflux transporter [Oscillospiraceae bacterium]
MMNLTTSIASMADSMIIGHYLDDSSLSVVTFAIPIFLVINALSALFAVGGCIAMSIDTGKGNRDDANRAFSTSIELLVGTGMILLTAGLFFSHTVTRWLGAEPDVFDQVQVYARIIMMGAPSFTLSTGLAFFVRNEGRATLSMVGMFSSIAADIILNFVFVGFMDMGVAGAGVFHGSRPRCRCRYFVVPFFLQKKYIKIPLYTRWNGGASCKKRWQCSAAVRISVCGGYGCQSSAYRTGRQPTVWLSIRSCSTWQRWLCPFSRTSARPYSRWLAAIMEKTIVRFGKPCVWRCSPFSSSAES